MDFLLAYRDPLFGLLVFFGLIFIISFFSYSWSLIKFKKQTSTLEEFFDRYAHSHAIGDLLEEYDEKKLLLLLAHSLKKEGDYEGAIALYGRLREQGSLQDKLFILQELADLYREAGFLQRSKEIYEEILRYTPKNHDVLEKLMILYEKLGMYDDALEVSKILGLLEVDSPHARYLQAKIAVQQGDIEKLVSLYRQDPGLVRLVFEWLFRYAPQEAWRHLREQDYREIVDILWFLPKEKIKTHTPFLQQLYSAKGYIDQARQSDIFELDLLLHYPKAQLDFEYMCRACKHIFPFSFTRCPKCGCVESPKVELIISKRGGDEESFAF